MSGAVKFFLAIIILVLVLAISWYTMIVPSNAALEKCKSQKANLESQLAKLQEASKQIKQWEKTVTDFQVLLNEVQKSTATSKEGFISSLLKDFEDLIAELAVRDRSVTVSSINLGNLTSTTVGGEEEGEEEGGGFATLSVPVRISMTGKYRTIIEFVDALGQLKLKKMVRINSIGLSASRPKPGESPTLSVRVTLNAFMFKTQ